MSETTNDPTQVKNDKIYLVADLEGKKLNAFKNEEGETVPFKKTRQSEFMRADKDSMLENFFANLFSQYNDPTKFKILEIPVRLMDSAFKLLDKMFKIQQPDETVAFLANHEIDPAAKKANPEKQQERQQAKQPAQGEQEYVPKPYRAVNENMLDWKQIEADFGITREMLANRGFLEDLLQGRKTKGTIEVNINFAKNDVFTAKYTGQARLYFVKDKLGNPILKGEGVNPVPKLKDYKNYVFSEKDKENLYRSGHMQKVASIMDKGERVNAVIGMDPYTNKLIHVRVDDVDIRSSYFGVDLTPKEYDMLSSGKKIYLEGMISQRTGKEFNGFLQISPDSRRVELSFENRNIFETQTVGGVKLSDKQMERLEDGFAIKVEDMISRAGEEYDRFIKINSLSGRPEFFRYNPDNPGEIIIPKYVGGVKLTEDDRADLSKGEAIWLTGLQKNDGTLIDRFVKLDMDTGKILYAVRKEDFHKSLDEWAEKKPEIPKERFGHVFTRQEYSDLKNFNAIYVDNFVNAEGGIFDSWLKVSKETGQLRYYNENPDAPKNTQRSDQRQSQGYDQRQNQSHRRGI